MKTIAISVTRTIDAEPADVYDVWLDKSSPGSPWFGVPKVILNPPQADALFYSAYRIEEREIAHYGRFVAVERPRWLQYTWVSEATHGMETLLTVTFEPLDGKTQVRVHHTNVPDDEDGRRHEHAWKFVLNRMSSHFAKGNPS